MGDVVRLAYEQREPQKRACGTCRHAPPGSFSAFARCRATNNYLDEERKYEDSTCGPNGDLWEPKPPRRGLFGWIKVLLVGE